MERSRCRFSSSERFQGTVNIGNMIGPMLLQPGIGRILDQKWSGQLANGLRVYGVDAFQAAFCADGRLASSRRAS
jgi:hypothetical protein